MAYKDKDKKQVALYLESEFLEKLDEIKIETGLSRQEVMYRALKDFLYLRFITYKDRNIVAIGSDLYFVDREVKK